MISLLLALASTGEFSEALARPVIASVELPKSADDLELCLFDAANTVGAPIKLRVDGKTVIAARQTESTRTGVLVAMTLTPNGSGTKIDVRSRFDKLGQKMLDSVKACAV